MALYIVTSRAERGPSRERTHYLTPVSWNTQTQSLLPPSLLQKQTHKQTNKHQLTMVCCIEVTPTMCFLNHLTQSDPVKIRTPVLNSYKENKCRPPVTSRGEKNSIPPKTFYQKKEKKSVNISEQTHFCTFIKIYPQYVLLESEASEYL